LPATTEIGLVAKLCTLALAVGLDVLALSVGIGVSRIAPRARLKIGAVFASAELIMQALGYLVGTGAGVLLGKIATAGSLVLLALIGAVMVYKAGRADHDQKFDLTRGPALLLAALSISLDSLGVGVALPALGIPLAPLLLTVSFTTTMFTLTGLSFGARLGERYETLAEVTAGSMLILLALFFAGTHLV
jgi:putative Mn2+ efflux pump MntP